MIDPDRVVAIDVHVHAKVSCTDPEDPVMGKFFDATSSYFKVPRQRPTMEETIDYYREQNMAFCLFTVDCESGLGARMGTGLKGGGGVKLKYGQPMLIDQVAVDFPDIDFILAHPGWPWTDESLSWRYTKPTSI